MTKREKLSDVKAARDHWRKLAENGLEPRIKSMSFGSEGFDMALTGEVVKAISVALVSTFKAGGAVNFMEMSIFDIDEPYQRYTVTVQKCGALSPADKLKAAEARNAELERGQPMIDALLNEAPTHD